MNEEMIDGTLEQLFQSAFALVLDEEDAFWRRFTERRGQEREVWKTFRSVMLGLNKDLRRSTVWAVWSARGIADASHQRKNVPGVA